MEKNITDNNNKSFKRIKWKFNWQKYSKKIDNTGKESIYNNFNNKLINKINFKTCILVT